MLPCHKLQPWKGKLQLHLNKWTNECIPCFPVRPGWFIRNSTLLCLPDIDTFNFVDQGSKYINLKIEDFQGHNHEIIHFARLPAVDNTLKFGPISFSFYQLQVLTGSLDLILICNFDRQIETFSKLFPQRTSLRVICVINHVVCPVKTIWFEIRSDI